MWAAVTKHPSPEDAKSIVNNTNVATLTTGFNAIIFTVSAATSGNASIFYPIWLCCTLFLCVWISRKSRLASQRTVTKLSRRAARKLIMIAVLLALPWAALPIYVFGFRGTGDPLVALVASAGMMAGGAFILHRAYVAALCYTVTITSAAIFAFHFGEWPQAWAVTAYSIVYAVFLSYFAHRIGETAREKDDSVRALWQAVENLKAARDENYQLANVDDITGLMNRKAFNDRVAQEVARCNQSGGGFTLLMLDLDRFKNVNDLFGHGVGDELLAVVANRLRANLSEKDIIGRLGGDEFSVLLVDVTDDARVRDISDRLLRALELPATLSVHSVHTGASIGAVVFPQDAMDPEELLLKADLSLNRAKDEGRGQCIMFDDTLREKVVSSNTIEAGLREALAQELVFIAYQPKVRLSDGSAVGAEALVRMRNPDGTIVPPDRFLPIAAERGLLPRLSRYISQRVAADIKTWRGLDFDPGKIALNIHPDDIKSPEFLMETIDLLEKQGVTAQHLTLEITEGCFIGRGTDRAAMVLDALAERGFDLSLDDFGTGHASLSHLKTIPVNEIKIDRSFVAGIEVRRDDRAIVSAIAEIARGMGIRSVAEGVENAAQLDILQDLGLNIGQGYYWSKPVEAPELLRFMHQSRKIAM